MVAIKASSKKKVGLTLVNHIQDITSKNPPNLPDLGLVRSD